MNDRENPERFKKRQNIILENLPNSAEKRLRHSAHSSGNMVGRKMEREGIQRALREAEGLAQGIVDALSSHIAVLDETGTILAINKAWRDFALANPPSDIGKMGVGSNYLSVCDQATGECAAEANAFAAGIRAVLRGEQERFEMEYPCHAPFAKRWFLGQVTRFAGEGPLRVVVAHENITARKLAEEELSCNAAHIQTLNDRLRRAMTETHHRVRNNLQIVGAMVDMQVLEGTPTLPTAEFKRLRGHVSALAAVHDLLTEQAKTDGIAESVEAEAVLEKLLPMLESIVAGRHFRFEVEANPRLSARQATALAMIANELVLNAVKHSRSEVEVRFTLQGGRALLEVRDDGPGFPPDFNPRQAHHTGLEMVENLRRIDLGGITRYTNSPEGGGRVLLAFLPSSVA